MTADGNEDDSTPPIDGNEAGTSHSLLNEVNLNRASPAVLFFYPPHADTHLFPTQVETWRVRGRRSPVHNETHRSHLQGTQPAWTLRRKPGSSSACSKSAGMH